MSFKISLLPKLLEYVTFSIIFHTYVQSKLTHIEEETLNSICFRFLIHNIPYIDTIIIIMYTNLYVKYGRRPGQMCIQTQWWVDRKYLTFSISITYKQQIQPYDTLLLCLSSVYFIERFILIQSERFLSQRR